jgi:hypothetical protein
MNNNNPSIGSPVQPNGNAEADVTFGWGSYRPPNRNEHP